MNRLWRNNGLTIVLIAVFTLSWLGQYIAGWRVLIADEQSHGQPATSFIRYALTGHFWQATGENWESEFLQMAMFVLLTCCLFQRGSPEANDPDESPDPRDQHPERFRDDPRAPWPVRRGGWVLKVYENSLSLCFIVLFLVSVTIHALGGWREYNTEQLEHGGDAVSLIDFLGSSEFWFQSFQNWQSEFLSLAAMVYLSVYLRQKGSAESKPVATPHDEHGE